MRESSDSPRVCFRTGNMPTNLGKTGAFVELTGSKYQEQSANLGRGDILVTKTSGHTVVVLSNGGRYEGSVVPVSYSLGDRILRYGCEGIDVKTMQELLLKLGYDLGAWGVDGDFGDATELALKRFQEAAHLDIDGKCGPITLAALQKAIEVMGDRTPAGNTVRIRGGDCYVRTAPDSDGKILGIVHNGNRLPYGGEVSDAGWHLVQYKNQNGGVSGKYSTVIQE